MTAPSATRQGLEKQARLRRSDLLAAAGAGAVAAAAATLLLGLSGWFLASAALAGLGGPVAVRAFNYLLPSAGFRALAITRTAGRYGERLFAHRAALLAFAALRPALFAGLAASPPEHALRLSSGEAAARLVKDVGATETAFTRRSAPWAAGAAAGAAAAAIAPASPWASLAFLAGLAAQLLAGEALARRLTREPGRDAPRAAGRLKAALNTYGAAAAELRCFDLTDRAVEAVMAHNADLGAAVTRHSDAEGWVGLVHAGLVAATLVLVAGLSGAAGLPLAALAVLSALAGMEGVAGLLRAAQEHAGYEEAIRRLDGVFQPAPAPWTPPAPDSGLEIDGRRLVPGDRLAIRGPSGAGKTRTLEALLGLRAAPAGRIRIAGTPLEAAPSGWARSLFAWAPQDARLLTGTIAENLRLADLDADAGAMWNALADAQLEARVRDLPAGLDTWIGEGGEHFSGGERRRLSLARAYLRPAPWLLLDEPTESVDPAVERAMVAALETRLRRTGQGAIIVSHRPAPLNLCSAILTLAQTPSGRNHLDGENLR